MQGFHNNEQVQTMGREQGHRSYRFLVRWVYVGDLEIGMSQVGKFRMASNRRQWPIGPGEWPGQKNAILAHDPGLLPSRTLRLR